MELNIAGRCNVADPTGKDIVHAFDAIQPNDEFIILESKDSSDAFIKACLAPKGIYSFMPDEKIVSLEYCEDGEVTHVVRGQDFSEGEFQELFFLRDPGFATQGVSYKEFTEFGTMFKKPLSKAEVVRTFQLYLAKDPNWKSLFVWKELKDASQDVGEEEVTDSLEVEDEDYIGEYFRTQAESFSKSGIDGWVCLEGKVALQTLDGWAIKPKASFPFYCVTQDFWKWCFQHEFSSRYGTMPINWGSQVIAQKVFEKINEKSQHEPIPLFSRCGEATQTEAIFALFKGGIYRFKREGYSQEQMRLMIMNMEESELQNYERLKNKWCAKKDEAKFRREKISEEVRIAVWRRDGGGCSRCGSREKLEYDHIVPVSKGGSNTARNIELLCEKCNRAKSDNIC